MNEQVTTEDFIDTVLNSKNKDTDIEWEGIKFTVKNTINFVSMESFVNYVTDICLINNEYHPELKDFAIKYATINAYTNISVPEDINSAYDLIYGSTLLETINDCIDSTQMKSLIISIDEMISYNLSNEVRITESKIDDFTSKLTEFEDSLSGALSDIDGDAIQKIADALSDGTFDSDKLVQSFLDTKYKH